MADSGGLITAVKLSTSNIPRLLTVNVPPLKSSGRSLPVRASSARCCDSRAIARIRRWSALRMTGTIRPCSSATAMPMCTCFFRIKRSSANETLTCGIRTNAIATAFTIRSLKLTLTGFGSFCAYSLTCRRKSASFPVSMILVT